MLAFTCTEIVGYKQGLETCFAARACVTQSSESTPDMPLQVPAPALAGRAESPSRKQVPDSWHGLLEKGVWQGPPAAVSDLCPASREDWFDDEVAIRKLEDR